MVVSRKQLRAMQERLEELERLVQAEWAHGAHDDELPVRGDEGPPPPEGQAFFAEMRRRLGDAQEGLISIIGGVYRFAPGKNLYFQSRYSNHPLQPPIVKCSDEQAIRLLSVLSSLQRVRLLEAMVGAVHSTTELRSKMGLGSGALSNHLRALIGAGFVERRGRGRYTLTGMGMSGIITFLHMAHNLRQEGPGVATSQAQVRRQALRSPTGSSSLGGRGLSLSARCTAAGPRMRGARRTAQRRPPGRVRRAPRP
jgi:DNA-binding transcriptional ArsR family regulator